VSYSISDIKIGKKMKNTYSNVIVRPQMERREVQITSTFKPTIDEMVIEKWQSMIDLLTKIIDVPAGLIMKLKEDSISVFMKSNNTENLYNLEAEEKLIYGLYCETVIGTQKNLIVPDARFDPVWKESNPDIELGMVSYCGFPLNWPDGEVFGTLCVLDSKENFYSPLMIDLMDNIRKSIQTDLELLQTNQQLAENNNELRELNDIKKKFLSLISHDVRGSVSTIREFTSMVLRQYDKIGKDKLHSYLISLNQSASYSFSILENLLTWSRNDLKQIAPQKVNFDIAELLKTIINQFSDDAKLKSITINVESFSPIVMVESDKAMMETAFRNVISNALKFSNPNSTVLVKISYVNNKHQIEIIDEGVGMDDETRNSLFKLSKKTSIGTAGEKSSGIGLTLAKEFLDKNGAEVEVESEQGKGTRFIIRI